MKFAVGALRQRDGITCGPAVAVVAGAMLDAEYGSMLRDSGVADTWFAREQQRVHAQVNAVWPRRLGTTPAGMARAFTERARVCGLRYRWRCRRGRCDRLADVLAAVGEGRPVAVLIGRVVPRHWVLLVEVSGDALRCYEPSSGATRSVSVDALRRGGLTGLGFPRAFAFVLPSGAVGAGPV
ncbi:hypothetical protein GR927_32185 [Mycolicibacterium sp. 3033]|nr:hypothetical protein [Mycolicibacterium aurantiacum]